jgi:glutamine synthetase
MGIPVKYHHHETGGPGQNEIEIPMLPLLKAADAVMMVKYVTKMVAHQAGLAVTFLPKPLHGISGSGMHFHQQLFDRESNLFYAAGEKNPLSQAALFYIGGLLTHAPAVMALTNPSTNSYRRLVPGFNAPTGCFFSTSQRAAAVRIPAYAQSPQAFRFEFRPPDGTCNPYLAISGMLMAGVTGMQNLIDPTSAGFGPIEEDVLAHPAGVQSLPTSLRDAIDSLANDDAFLVQGAVVDPRLIREWIRAKRQEILEVEARPHPFEVQNYFDV